MQKTNTHTHTYIKAPSMGFYFRKSEMCEHTHKFSLHMMFPIVCQIFHNLIFCALLLLPDWPVPIFFFACILMEYLKGDLCLFFMICIKYNKYIFRKGINIKGLIDVFLVMAFFFGRLLFYHNFIYSHRHSTDWQKCNQCQPLSHRISQK